MKPRPTRKIRNLWIEILLLGTGSALSLALLIATLGIAAGATGEPESTQAAAPPVLSPAPQASAPQQTFEGMVTCSQCGARHSASIAKNASDCVRICVHGGAKFALLSGDSVYVLNGNLDQLKKVAGERAKITGVMNGSTIEVSAVAAGS